MLVDVHTHLDDEKFSSDIDDVILRAKNAGVIAIISNGLNLAGNKRVLELSKRFPLIKPAFGFYPCENDDVEEVVSFIEKHKSKVFAIGEVGLDYKWVKGKEEEQKKIFMRMIELANTLHKPLIVHSRDAEEDCIDMLEKNASTKIVMHCFGGNMKLVEKIARNQWHFSIPTNVVFSNHFQNIVSKVDISLLLTETDAPYLGPIKGQRNEPANISYSVKKIGELKKMDVEEVKNNIYMNYQKVFL